MRSCADTDIDPKPAIVFSPSESLGFHCVVDMSCRNDVNRHITKLHDCLIPEIFGSKKDSSAPCLLACPAY